MQGKGYIVCCGIVETKTNNETFIGITTYLSKHVFFNGVSNYQREIMGKSQSSSTSK